MALSCEPIASTRPDGESFTGDRFVVTVFPGTSFVERRKGEDFDLAIVVAHGHIFLPKAHVNGGGGVDVSRSPDGDGGSTFAQGLDLQRNWVWLRPTI